MKVKITVWTLASDDDNGTQAAVFTTEREALEAYAGWVIDQGDREQEKKDREKAARLISKHCEDLSWSEVADQDEGEENEDIYDFLRDQHGPLSTYSIESSEIEVEVGLDTRTNHDGSIKSTARMRDENLAAISAEFHSNRDRWKNFYDRHGASLDGFPGIWRYMIEAADAFTAAEEAFEKAHGGGSYEYIDSILNYAEILLVQENLAVGKDLDALAEVAIDQAKA